MQQLTTQVSKPLTPDELATIPPGPKLRYAVYDWPARTVALTNAGAHQFSRMESAYEEAAVRVMPVLEFLRRLRLAAMCAGRLAMRQHLELLPYGHAKGWLHAVQYGDDAALGRITDELLKASPSEFGEFVEQAQVGDGLQEDELSLKWRRVRMLPPDRRAHHELSCDPQCRLILESARIYTVEEMQLYRNARQAKINQTLAPRALAGSK